MGARQPGRKGAALKKYLLLIVCFFLLDVFLFASGKQEEIEGDPLYNEWTLCITEFDFSGISPARRVAAEVILNQLFDKLTNINYRVRISPEYAYYESYAWRESVMSTAMGLSQKHKERSALLFAGHPEFRYKTNLKRIDEEIERLKAELEEKESNKPLIDTEPVFNLSFENLNRVFPTPPAKNQERAFCKRQGADAFLTGQVREFHGRFIIRIQMYILYTNSFIYEDDIIFSLEDTSAAVDEISSRLMIVLSGSKPAAIAVNASPPEAQILINSNFAGRGTVEQQERPPGTIQIAVAAEGYSPVFVETDIASGELTKVDVTLSPLHYSDVLITVPEFSPVNIYSGSLYMGDAPLILNLPIDNLEYIYAVTGTGQEAKAVFTTPQMPGDASRISLDLKLPHPSGEKRVEKARSRHYWNWGFTWISGIAAWILNGVTTSYANDINNGTDVFYSRYNTLSIVSVSSLAAFGGVIVSGVVQMIRYLYNANEGAVPILKDEKRERSR